MFQVVNIRDALPQIYLQIVLQSYRCRAVLAPESGDCRLRGHQSRSVGVHLVNVKATALMCDLHVLAVGELPE